MFNNFQNATGLEMEAEAISNSTDTNKWKRFMDKWYFKPCCEIMGNQIISTMGICDFSCYL